MYINYKICPPHFYTTNFLKILGITFVNFDVGDVMKHNVVRPVILIPVDKLMLICIRNVRYNVYLLKNC